MGKLCASFTAHFTGGIRDGLFQLRHPDTPETFYASVPISISCNPFPAGTRQHVLWTSSFHASGVALGGGIRPPHVGARG